MTLKSAALLALVGMILLTLLMAATFIISVTGFMHGVVSLSAVLSALIRLLAAMSLAVFFYVFNRGQA